jgi:hypothetical protein
VFVADSSKAQRLLGWTPKVAPDVGVERLLHWVRANRALFAARPTVAASQDDHAGLAA